MKKQLNFKEAELQKSEEIILNPEIDLKLRKTELCKISGKETLVLAEIFYELQKQKDYALLIDIVEKIQSEKFAYQIACDRDNDFVIRETAIRRIRTQRWLFALAFRNDAWEIRKMAISRMNNIMMLKALTKTARNYFIAEMAKRRIDEVKNRDAWLKSNPEDSL